MIWLAISVIKYGLYFLGKHSTADNAYFLRNAFYETLLVNRAETIGHITALSTF